MKGSRRLVTEFLAVKGRVKTRCQLSHKAGGRGRKDEV